MLTRPLAYKGPTDHLSQHFELQKLYQGMQVLLQGALMDWQQQKEEKQVQGVFFAKGKLIKTYVAWPLSAETSVNTCACQSNQGQPDNADNADEPAVCEHITALAIETKTRLDRLPQSLKQTETFHSEWQYLTDWISRQSFDPFPNMARHRVIYILDGDKDQITVSVHKAYLSQQNEFQKKAELDLSVLSKGKLPKFVSLTDQQIIHQMNQLCRQQPQRVNASNGMILFQANTNTSQSQQEDLKVLIKRITLSGRSFWRACHRHPLGYMIESKFKSDWWFLGEQLFLDISKSRIVDLTPVIDENVEKFLELTSQQQSNWQPALTLSSEQIALPWNKQSVEIDVAKVSFRCDSEQGLIEVKLQDLMAYVYHTSKRNNSVILESIAKHIHQLDWLASVFINFERPICENFDICDRYLDGNFAHWLPLLRGLEMEGWFISFDKRFRLNQKKIDSWYSKVTSANQKTNSLTNQSNGSQSTLQTENDWFDLEVGIKVDGQPINLMPHIISALQQGLWDFSDEDQSSIKDNLYLTLDDGTRVELAYQRVRNILNTLLELYESKPLTDKQQLRLPSNQFARLINLEQQTGQENEWQAVDWLKQKANALTHSQGIVTTQVPNNVIATLRDYQLEGLNWLQFLSRESLAGILADDMGLGKTLQTLAHIQCEKNSGNMKSPCMVVAPTSLLGNWYAEASKFTPDLKLVYWAGGKRHLSQQQLADADLIITSYGLLIRDADLLNQQGLHLLVLDEAQAIKNSRSKVSKIAFTLQSKYRLCLTGTPLENHLGELWSLFHFLMPGFLGDEAQFKRLFRIPIEKEHDFERQKELAERIAPFMLRRTKDKVAADLPAKTIIEEFIELSDSQADYYETIRLSMFEEVQKAVSRTNTGASSGKNHLLIGNALLRLRQVCCHPNLIINKLLATEVENEDEFEQGDLFSAPSNDKQQQKQNLNNSKTVNKRQMDSAKLAWLEMTLPEMIQNGRKILIFSSFTSMLSIIEDSLKNLSIDFLSLTGKTKKRSELVEKFQQGDIPVFLISLKAGGSGLNLTEADTVIHFDPWWNPAAENQASDRAHRIGQDKPVFVYKLITKGTVEERINIMQQQKSQLAEELYQKSEKQTLLDRPDWQTLLAPLGDAE